MCAGRWEELYISSQQLKLSPPTLNPVHREERSRTARFFPMEICQRVLHLNTRAYHAYHHHQSTHSPNVSQSCCLSSPQVQRYTQSGAFGPPHQHIVQVVMEEEDELAGQVHNNHTRHGGGFGSLSQLCQAEHGKEYLLAIAEWSRCVCVCVMGFRVPMIGVACLCSVRM